MYIIIDKKTDRFIRDTGIIENTDCSGLYNTLLNNIDTTKEKIIYLDNNSPFVSIFNSLVDNEFMVELSYNEVIGVKVI